MVYHFKHSPCGHSHLPRSSEKLIPSLIFPPTTENNSAPDWLPPALLQRYSRKMQTIEHNTVKTSLGHMIMDIIIKEFKIYFSFICNQIEIIRYAVHLSILHVSNRSHGACRYTKIVLVTVSSILLEEHVSYVFYSSYTTTMFIMIMLCLSPWDLGTSRSQ